MSAHLSPEQLAKYSRRKLAPEELMWVDEHLYSCARCADRLGETKAAPAVPSFLAEVGHLTYEEMTAVLDSKLKATEREAVEGHIAACPRCERELRDLCEFDLRMSVQKRKVEPGFWEQLTAFFALPQRAIGALAIAVTAVALLWRTPASNSPLAHSASETAVAAQHSVVRVVAFVVAGVVVIWLLLRTRQTK